MKMASKWLDITSKTILTQKPTDESFAIHFRDIGKSAGLGETIVLVHGFTQTGYSWDPLIEGKNGLIENGHRAIVVDLRGHGQSSWSAQGDYSRQSMVNDIHCVVDALKLEHFALIGLSMGGALSARLAALLPDRVSSLTVVDWAPWPNGKPTKGVSRIGRVFQLRWDTFEEAVDMMHSFNPRRSRENVSTRMKQQLRQAEDGWRWGTDPAFSKDASERARESPDVMWNNVRSIRCKTLMLLGGESDVVPSSQADLMIQNLSKGKLVIIQGAGHSVIGDQPQRSKAAIMPFLRELNLSKSNL